MCTFNSFKYLFLSLEDLASTPHSFADQSPKFRVSAESTVFNLPISQLDDIHDHLDILHIGIRSILSLKEKDIISLNSCCLLIIHVLLLASCNILRFYL